MLAQRPYDLLPWLFASSSAEYARPAWERSTHAKKMDSALNAPCRLITGCLRPTPEIRRNAVSSRECHRQLTDERHPLFGHATAKSRQSFLNAVNPSAVVEDIRSAYWTKRLDYLPSKTSMSMCAKEELTPGADSSWAEWKCLQTEGWNWPMQSVPEEVRLP